MPKTKSNIRVRLAPSPTGNFHVGTARTAIFNYLFARQQGGKFIVRIEDTDLERSDKKYEKNILEGLEWLGLEYDEGPGEAGECGPYRQTERLDTYEKYLKKLLDEKKAYHCFCSEEELEKERKNAEKRGEAPIYSGKCRDLDVEEAQESLNSVKGSIIRFKTPWKRVKFKDLVRGEVEFDTKLIGDFAIAKDLNSPLFNFAVVVDDATMEISHVIRGEDHISNTPKQILIQETLGFDRPEYAHIPLILNKDKSKLSKRKNRATLNDYKELGYFQEAMLNYLALLGWNPKSEQEIFSKEELIKEFDFAKINKSGAVFDIEKLDWVNGHYIRGKDLGELTELCLPYLVGAGLLEGVKKSRNQEIKKTSEAISFEYLKKIIGLEQERIRKLVDIAEFSKFFFEDHLGYETDLLIWKKITREEVKNSLLNIKERLSKLDVRYFNQKDLEKTLKKLGEEKGIGTGEMLWPLRVALTGLKASPSPFEVAETLASFPDGKLSEKGKEKVLKRIDQAIKRL